MDRDLPTKIAKTKLLKSGSDGQPRLSISHGPYRMINPFPDNIRMVIVLLNIG